MEVLSSTPGTKLMLKKKFLKFKCPEYRPSPELAALSWELPSSPSCSFPLQLPGTLESQ